MHGYINYFESLNHLWGFLYLSSLLKSVSSNLIYLQCFVNIWSYAIPNGMKLVGIESLFDKENFEYLYTIFGALSWEIWILEVGVYNLSLQPDRVTLLILYLEKYLSKLDDSSWNGSEISNPLTWNFWFELRINNLISISNVLEGAESEIR